MTEGLAEEVAHSAQGDEPDTVVVDHQKPVEEATPETAADLVAIVTQHTEEIAELREDIEHLPETVAQAIADMPHEDGDELAADNLDVDGVPDPGHTPEAEVTETTVPRSARPHPFFRSPREWRNK